MDKQQLLAQIQQGFEQGILSKEDLLVFTGTNVGPILATNTPDAQKSPTTKPNKLTAVDIIFYVAGILLYSAILTIIIQAWGEENILTNTILSVGIGVALWAVAHRLLQSKIQSDVRHGVINSMILTGSLSIITGGYIVSNTIVGGFGELNFIAGSVMLFVLGIVHLFYDRLVKRDQTLLTGVLLCVFAFPSLMFGILKDSGFPEDIWALVFIGSAVLLGAAARVISKVMPERSSLRSSFDSFGALVGLTAMYTASYSDYGTIWLGVLIVSILGIFYFSIVSQNKKMLGSATFFLILTVLTISFKYFSGFGATASLIVAAAGLLGSAAVATGINKKYFKTPTAQ